MASLAASLAASLKAREAAKAEPTAQGGTKATSLASDTAIKKDVRLAAESEGSVSSVEMDGLAVLKVLEHSHDAAHTKGLGVAGYLLGVNLSGCLSISNTIALPVGHLLPANITTFLSAQSSSGSDEASKAAKIQQEREREFDMATRHARAYASALLPRLKESNYESEVCGFYVSTRDGMNTLKEGALVDMLIRYQLGSAEEAKKAVKGITPGRKPVGGRGIALVYDITSTTSSTVSLKAYRLSEPFCKLVESNRFDYAALAEARLTPSSILSSFPVTLTSSSLLSAFLNTLPSENRPQPYKTLESSNDLESSIKSLLSALDTSNASIQSLGYQGRAARYSRSENAMSDNLSRLDVVRSLSALDGAAQNLSQGAGRELISMFGSKTAVI